MLLSRGALYGKLHDFPNPSNVLSSSTSGWVLLVQLFSEKLAAGPELSYQAAEAPTEGQAASSHGPSSSHLLAPATQKGLAPRLRERRRQDSYT